MRRLYLLAIPFILLCPVRAQAQCSNTNISNGWTCVQQASDFSYSTGNTLSFGSASAIGNPIVCSITSTNTLNNETLTSSGGDTWHKAAGSALAAGYGRMVLWWTTAVSTATETFTFGTGTGAFPASQCSEYKSVSGTPTFDQTCNGTTVTGNATCAVTPTQANELMVAGMIPASGGTTVWNTGTKIVTAADAGGAYNTQSGTSPFTFSEHETASLASGLMVVTFYYATSGSTGRLRGSVVEQ